MALSCKSVWPQVPLGSKYSTRVSAIMGGGMIWRGVAICIRKFQIPVAGRRDVSEKVHFQKTSNDTQIHSRGH